MSKTNYPITDEMADYLRSVSGSPCTLHTDEKGQQHLKPGIQAALQAIHALITNNDAQAAAELDAKLVRAMDSTRAAIEAGETVEFP